MEARAKAQCASGDSAEGNIDWLRLWYIKHQNENEGETPAYPESTKVVG
jgi:hypothetical protein